MMRGQVTGVSETPVRATSTCMDKAPCCRREGDERECVCVFYDIHVHMIFKRRSVDEKMDLKKHFGGKYDFIIHLCIHFFGLILISCDTYYYSTYIRSHCNNNNNNNKLLLLTVVTSLMVVII